MASPSSPPFYDTRSSPEPEPLRFSSSLDAARPFLPAEDGTASLAQIAATAESTAPASNTSDPIPIPFPGPNANPLETRRYLPYWHAHQRSISNISYTSIQNQLTRRSVIALEDHSEAHSDESRALWVKYASVDEWVVVGKGGLGAGTYVVWNCTVETLDGGPMKMMKRYSDFDLLRQRLVTTFPRSEAAMPPLPPKSVLSKFRTKFLEKRKAGLSYFLNCVLLNPEFAGSSILKEFLVS